MTKAFLLITLMLIAAPLKAVQTRSEVTGVAPHISHNQQQARRLENRLSRTCTLPSRQRAARL